MQASAGTTNYTLTLNDMSAWMNIINMQSQVVLSAPLSDSSYIAFNIWTALFTSNKFPRQYMPGGGNGYDVTPVCSLVSNTEMLQWIETLFTELQKLQLPALKSSYSEGFAASLWYAIVLHLDGLEPMKAAGWGNTILDHYASWKKAGHEDPPPNLEICDLWHGDKWCKVDQMQPTVSVLWNSQFNTLKTLIELKELTSEQCMFLMFLLSSLCSGTTDHQRSVQQIVSANCSSIELPNTNFYTSLLYVNLMQLADPMSSYVQTNAQIKGVIDNLIAQTTGTDAASAGIKSALVLQSKILLVSANYPMVDPYNPQIGFNTRLSDMLEAINTTWSAIKITL